MPLKKSVKHVQSAKVAEGDPIQTLDHGLMSLTDPILGFATLNTEQFIWPESFVVRSVRRSRMSKKDPKTGFNQKDVNGNKIVTNNYQVSMQLSDANMAQLMLNGQGTIDGLKEITCVFPDISVDRLKEDESTIKLEKPTVRLQWDGNGFNTLVIHAEGFKEV